MDFGIFKWFGVGRCILWFFMAWVIVVFHGLPTGGLPTSDLVVVKIIVGVGNPFRDLVVVILWGWLPFGWLRWLSLFFCHFGFPKTVTGMIWELLVVPSHRQWMSVGPKQIHMDLYRCLSDPYGLGPRPGHGRRAQA